MNTKFLLLVISVAAFSSCTTLYKSGQTPDDVYYSPARPSGGGNVEERSEQQNYQANNYASDDRVIRLGINDARWRYLDYNYNYSNSLFINDYSYNPYTYGFNYGYYYNPYFWPYPVYGYGSVFVKNSTPKITTPRMTNLGAYNPAYNNSTQSYRTHGGTTRPTRTYNNSNRGSAVGNVMRQVFAPSNSNSNNSNNNINNSSSSNRTYSPSSSSSSSSGSSSSGSGSVSRPARH